MVLLAWSTATANAPPPTLTVAGLPAARPVCPLHAAPLMTDTVSPLPEAPAFAT